MPRREVTAVEALIGFNDGPTITYGTKISQDMLNASLIGLELTFSDGTSKKNVTNLSNIADNKVVWKVSQVEAEDFTYYIGSKEVKKGDLVNAGTDLTFSARLPAGLTATFRKDASEIPDPNDPYAKIEYSLPIPQKTERRKITITKTSPQLKFEHKDYYHLQCRGGGAVACPTLETDNAKVYLFDSQGNRQETTQGITVQGSIRCPACCREQVSDITISYGPTTNYYKEEIKFPITVKVSCLDI